jgi:hypothetical protein
MATTEAQIDAKDAALERYREAITLILQNGVYPETIALARAAREGGEAARLADKEGA